MKCVQFTILFLCLPSCFEGVTIHDRIGAVDSFYDISKDVESSVRATPKTSIQAMQASFTYNDMDDAIHIIEPPQQFQEMKRRHRQQHNPVSNILGARLQQHMPSPMLQVAASKVKEHAHAVAKVEKPEMIVRQRQYKRRKPAIVAGKLEPGASDLLTQETRTRAEAQRPLEILASVRKTEQKMEHKQQQRPFAKQRIKLQKSHTVIMERGYEHSRFKHGQENRVGGFNGNSKSMRRAQRVRRDMPGSSIAAIGRDIDQAQRVANLNIEQGSQLLARLDALLKHASRFLPDDNDTATHNNVLDELRQRFQHEFEPKQLIGEIEPTTKPTSPERELYQILESSLNATDSIMQELIQRRVGNVQSAVYPSSKCGGSELLNFNGSALQQLQSKVDCMREQLTAVRESAAPTTTTTTTAPLAPGKFILASTLTRGNTRFGQRTRNKATTTSTSTTTLPFSKSTLRTRTKKQRDIPLNASVRSDAFPETQQTQRFLSHKAKSGTHQIDSRNVTAAAAILLYDDVMANIRNMLEAKNLKLPQVLPESRKTDARTNEEAGIAVDFIEASPSTLSVDASDDTSYFRDLGRYLSELQQIVTGQPQTKTEFNGSSNSRSGSTSSHTDWYLINEEGKISETSFDVQLQPTAVIFHRFPDIPNAAVYVRNRTSFTALNPATATQQENPYEMF